MLEALTHAVVHMVAFRCNDPVMPLDILELDVEVFLAAHSHIITTTQRALSESVFGVVITETHLGHQKGLVRCISRVIKGTKVLSILVTTNLQTQQALATIQEGLQGAFDGEGVPVTVPDLEHLFYHQGAVRG